MWFSVSASSGEPLKAIVQVNAKEGSHRPPDQDMWGERDSGHQPGVEAIKRPSEWLNQESPLCHTKFRHYTQNLSMCVFTDYYLVMSDISEKGLYFITDLDLIQAFINVSDSTIWNDHFLH